MIQIYQIDFPDGAAYVGQTIRPIEKRIWSHGYAPVNHELAKRLHRGDAYTVKVLSRHRLPARAYEAEVKAIMALEKPINKWHVTKPTLTNGKGVNLDKVRPAWRRRRKRVYERTRPIQKCSWCWRVLKASEFGSDRGRAGGLASRCKDCEQVRKSYIAKAMKVRCNAYKTAYQQAKAERMKPGPKIKGICSWCKSKEKRKYTNTSTCKDCNNYYQNLVKQHCICTHDTASAYARAKAERIALRPSR